MSIFQSTKPALRRVHASFWALLAFTLSRPALAAGGLQEANNWVDEITTWAYAFLGSAVLLYCVYLVIMALLEKKQWGDVFVGMGKTAAAGGIIVAATYAWSIWGS